MLTPLLINPFLPCLFLGVLWSGPFCSWILLITGYKVNLLALTRCKPILFMFHFFFTYSSVLLVIISVEKFIALYFPFKAKTICTIKAAHRVCFITAIIYAIFNGQYFFILKVSTYPNGFEFCDYASGISKSYLHISNDIILAITYSFGPFIIMIIVNFAIIYKFAVAKWNDLHGVSGSTDQAMSKSAVKGTTMLLTVSFAFIILTGPTAAVQAIFQTPPPVIMAIVSPLQNSNNAINSVLYCMSGSRFREELINTVCCKKRLESNSQNQNTSAMNVH